MVPTCPVATCLLVGGPAWTVTPIAPALPAGPVSRCADPVGVGGRGACSSPYAGPALAESGAHVPAAGTGPQTAHWPGRRRSQ